MVTMAQRTPLTAARPSRDWLAAAVLALVVLATRGIWFGDPVAEFDEQLYSLVGWRMTHGDLPYIDLWDRKPFGLFAIFAAAHWLFGPEPVAYQALAAVFALAGAMLVYGLARDLVDRATATVAGALYVMLMALYGSQSGQSEIFFMPLMLAMLWLVRDWRRPGAVRRAAIAMLIGGIALQVKYTVLPQCVFFGAYALYGQWRRGTKLPGLAGLAVLFGALGILPTAIVGALYAYWGHFDAFWFANFVSFFDRIPGGRFHAGHLIALYPIGVPIVAGLYAAWRLNPPADWGTYGLYAGWTVATLGTVFLPGTVYLYYYGALAPCAVLLALPLMDRRTVFGIASAVLLLIGPGRAIDLPHRYVSSQNERRTEMRLSAAIAPYVGSRDNCLYVFDGPTVLYRTTGSCVPTRFVYPDHLNNALEIRAIGVDQPAEIARILAGRPGVIVTAGHAVTVQRRKNLALIEEATQRDYRPLITASLQTRSITAWVRRDLTGG